MLSTALITEGIFASTINKKYLTHTFLHLTIFSEVDILTNTGLSTREYPHGVRYEFSWMDIDIDLLEILSIHAVY